MPLLGAVGSRSILRDCQRRLGEMRVACGKDDGFGTSAQQFQPTGDPFADRAQLFKRHAEQCKAAISERSDAHKGNTPEDRTKEAAANAQVVDLIRTMKKGVEEMEKLVADANGSWFVSTQKGQSPEKQQTKQRLFEERNAGHRQAVITLRDIEKLNTASDDRATMAKQVREGRKPKDRMRRAMETLEKAQGQTLNTGQVQRMADLESEPYGAEPIVTLADSPEYRDQLRTIQQQKIEIDRGLDRISAAVLRLRHLANGIGDELESQNKMLVETEERIRKQADSIKTVRKQVDMVLKKQKPLNMCINAFCFLVLLALIGFFLIKFKVV